MTHPAQDLHSFYPISALFLPPDFKLESMSELADAIRKSPVLHHERPYLADLAKLEHIRSLVSLAPLPQDKVSDWVVNPSLELVPVHWLKLPAFLDDQVINIPERGDEWVLIWKHPASRLVQICPASGHDLLALKIVSEGLRIRDAAWEGKVTTGHINDILASAVQRGILLAPPSRLERDETFPRGTGIDPHFFSSPTFTLQWHITQACDLHCRHCYDRSERATLELSQGIRVLDDLYDFSATHFVSTQVSFTGGNPLLYPDFNALYKESSDRGFMTAILGNPMPKKQIEKMLSIRKPEFYQVSLEGLRDHNDYIRGSGHFDRTLDFLDLLRELGIYSMVMLTLTRNNRDQVLELAELLRERVDLFTFNRLAMVGEGAALASVTPENFPAFLQSYRQAAEKNSCIGLKDNLFNLRHHEQGLIVNGGCTGYGCGAGFNFLSLLPDGEVHACRKLPSLIGNAYQQTLDEIYHGPLAQQYRLGTAACRECPIRPVCGGCLAVSHGYGLDIFQERDPYCWKDKKK